MAAFFSTELPCGTRMTARKPSARAAKPMDWPWLPRVAVITPATSGSRSFSAFR